jgi:hypothetical protein
MRYEYPRPGIPDGPTSRWSGQQRSELAVHEAQDRDIPLALGDGPCALERGAGIVNPTGCLTGDREIHERQRIAAQKLWIDNREHSLRMLDRCPAVSSSGLDPR